MITVNMHDAKTRFSALLAAVEKGNETILVCRNGHPVAEIHAVEKAAKSGLPAPKPARAPVLKYDPAEPLSEDEWPGEYR